MNEVQLEATLQAIQQQVRSPTHSLFMEWAQHQRRPDHVTTTDFQTLMAEDHRSKALRFVLVKRPSLKNLS